MAAFSIMEVVILIVSVLALHPAEDVTVQFSLDIWISNELMPVEGRATMLFDEEEGRRIEISIEEEDTLITVLQDGSIRAQSESHGVDRVMDMKLPEKLRGSLTFDDLPDVYSALIKDTASGTFSMTRSNAIENSYADNMVYQLKLGEEVFMNVTIQHDKDSERMQVAALQTFFGNASIWTLQFFDYDWP